MGTLASGSIDLNSLKVAGEPNKYITTITNSGIKVQAQDATNYITLDPSGMIVYKNNSPVAQFGSTTRIGDVNKASIELSTNGLILKDYNNTQYGFWGLNIQNSEAQIGYYAFYEAYTNSTLTIDCDYYSDYGSTMNDFFVYLNNSLITKSTTYYSFQIIDDIVRFTLNTTPITGGSGYAIGDEITITVNYSNLTGAKSALIIGNYDNNINYGANSLLIGSGQPLGINSFVQGEDCIANGKNSHAEGYNTVADGSSSHAEGYMTTASNVYSHAEGFHTQAIAAYSHAEGNNTVARSTQSHAEGDNTQATGSGSHAEGVYGVAHGQGSHVEGVGGYYVNNYAYDIACHVEGIQNSAKGRAGHAEGEKTYTNADWTHAQNYYTYANKKAQTTLGTYNIKDESTFTTHPSNESDYGQYAVIIGNGIPTGSNPVRSNALTVDWSGNIMAQGMAGQIIMYAGSTAPTGWLLCNGQAVSRTTYATLFAIIGTTYGAGDGSTTFNVPDFRDRVGVGAGTTYNLNDTGGEATHTLDATEIPAHTHGNKTLTGQARIQAESALNTVNMINSVSGIVGRSTSSSGYYTISGRTSINNQYDILTVTATHEHNSVGGSGAHNNMQPYIGINYIICTGKTY